MPGGRPGDHRSRSGRHCTARLPELHGLDSSLHRYPLALNTDGEPYAAETPPKPHGHEHARAHTVDMRTAVAKPPRPHHRSRSDATALAGSFSLRKTPRSRSVKT